jgi:uncharacterized protein YndB with AHSA1/START domain
MSDTNGQLIHRSHAQTNTFSCHTDADLGRVWTALTDPEQTKAYLYGLALHSEWTAGAALEVVLGERTVLAGRVLCVRKPERLSYLLQEAPDQPSAYLTWLVRPSRTGATVGLSVDEIECADGVIDGEDTWLPVLAGLQHLLRAS